MIYSYQKDVYGGIRKAMAVHEYSKGLDLPVKPRTHTLVIGPTGTGKTHIANGAIKASNWGCYHINCSAWMVTGARGDNHTLPNLVTWVANEPADRPLAVILDEVDKTQGNTDWYRNVQCEAFSLLDRHLLPGEYDLGGISDNEVERRFKKLFIVGCGAFQSIEDAPQQGLGFNPEDKSERSLDALSGLLSRELVNRFSDKILRLPKLGHSDYREIVNSLYKAANDEVRVIIKRIAGDRISSAEKNHTGARFGELLAAEVIENLIQGQDVPSWMAAAKSKDLVSDDLFSDIG